MNESTLTVILGGLFGLSEILALIPGIKANSVFQLVFNLLGKLAGKS
jgi:TctA family transporter